jgi:hypothetical protein
LSLSGLGRQPLPARPGCVKSEHTWTSMRPFTPCCVLDARKAGRLESSLRVASG